MTGERSEELLETGRLLFAGQIEFVMGAVSLNTLPDGDRPEVTFAGRSNVGKSSLINALTGHKNLARTSNTPGRTQELNYFRMGEQMNLPLYLVDVPGYGYAQVSKSKVANWTELVMTYLRGRASLRRVFLLIDGRHGIKDNDAEVMKMLDSNAVNYQIVLTKMDKLKVAEREKRIEKTREQLAGYIACHPVIHATSSDKGWGLAELKADIADLART